MTRFTTGEHTTADPWLSVVSRRGGKAAPVGDGARVEIGPGRDAPEKTVTRAAVREMILRQESHIRTT